VLSVLCYFTDSAAMDFFEEEDDLEMATVASQAEEQLPQGILILNNTLQTTTNKTKQYF